jgi:hypothetical protein
VGSEDYSLREAPDGRFEVQRTADGVVLGTFDAAPGGVRTVRAAGPARRVVRAIARLLAAPRGLLPLQ